MVGARYKVKLVVKPKAKPKVQPKTQPKVRPKAKPKAQAKPKARAKVALKPVPEPTKCLLITLVDDPDGPKPLFDEDGVAEEKTRLRKIWRIFAKQSHTGGADARVSKARDTAAKKQVNSLSLWQRSRIAVRKAIVPTEISDKQRRLYEQSESVLQEKKSRQTKENLIILADKLGDDLIQPFLKKTRTWPMTVAFRDSIAPLYFDIDVMEGAVYGLPKRMKEQIAKAFHEKPPVDPEDDGKPIPMSSLLDIAAYASNDRLDRYDAETGGEAVMAVPAVLKVVAAAAARVAKATIESALKAAAKTAAKTASKSQLMVAAKAAVSVPAKRARSLVEPHEVPMFSVPKMLRTGVSATIANVGPAPIVEVLNKKKQVVRS